MGLRCAGPCVRQGNGVVYEDQDGWGFTASFGLPNAPGPDASWGSLFVSSGCYKLGGRKITTIPCLTVLEVSTPKSKCQQGWFPQRTLQDNLFQASLLAPRCLLAIFGVPWLRDTST